MNKILSYLFFSGYLFHSTAALMEGATLMPASNSTTLYSIDQSSVLKTWARGGYSGYLTPQGTLLFHISGSSTVGNRCPPNAGYNGVGEMDWNGNIIRSVSGAELGNGLHHAINFTPDGRWLIIAAELVNYNGRSICSEKIIDYDPNTRQILWQWRAADHFTTDQSDYGKIHSSLLSTSDPLHFNSVDFDPINNLIVISAHWLFEILVIDRSTTTAQAATSTGGRFGKGGDILFRWGKATNYGISNSVTYVREAVHGAAFVPPGLPGAGNILLFANQSPAFGNRSMAFEVRPVLQGNSFQRRGSGELDYSIPFYFDGGTKYISNAHFGGVQRLWNGNTVITFSQGNVAVEVDNNSASTGGGNVLYEWFFSGSVNHGILRYPLCYEGLRNTSIYNPQAEGCNNSTVPIIQRKWSSKLNNKNSFRYDAAGRLPTARHIPLHPKNNL